MRITLNLATRPFADLGPAIKRLRIAMGVMALASILLGVGLYLLHHKAEEARARAHSLDGKIAAISAERQGYINLMAQPANAQLLTQVAALNKLFDKKTFSWTLAMEDLETVLPGGVQVATLEPQVDEKTGVISLHIRVIGPRDRTVELVQNLEHSRRFVLPRIIGENAETSGAPGEKLEAVSASNRVNFDLLAQYNVATVDELKKAAKPQKHEEEANVPQPAPAQPVAKLMKPKPGLTPSSQVKQPEGALPAFPMRRPQAPYPNLRPGQTPNQLQPPRPAPISMTGQSYPPPVQPQSQTKPKPSSRSNPRSQPNQGGAQ